MRVGRLDAARELLRRTDAVLVRGDTVQIDDRALAARLGSGPEPLADLERRIAAADRAIREPIAGSAADERLRAILDERGSRAPGGGVIDLLAAVAFRVWEALGRPDPSVLVPAQLAVGGALALVLALILVRGVRERLRTEVVVPQAQALRSDEPAVRAREARDALARGDLAAAIHAYYRFAFATLAAREAIAYDPALTDHELLERAAAVPHAGALRELVALNERVWFGLRPPGPADGERARDLAERVAG